MNQMIDFNQQGNLQMKKNYFNICYDILSHYLHFPDVADTVKSINEAMNYLEIYLHNPASFLQKNNEIIDFIVKARKNNIIDAYKDPENYLAFIPQASGRTLNQLNSEELCNNLLIEYRKLIVKGIHQVIKHLFLISDDNNLTAELLQQDIHVLQKYNLQGAKEN